MSVLLIWCSPNADGLTSEVKDALASGVEDGGGVLETVHLNEVRLELCRTCGNGWGTCLSQGRCCLNDGFNEIYAKCAEADGIILVTPVYWHDMAERLKTLLDRMRRCESRGGGAMRGARFLLAACAGGTGRGTTACLCRMEEALDCMGAETVERLSATRFSRDFMLPVMRAAGARFAELAGKRNEK